MTLVSLTNCCHLLAIDAKTLRRWMSLSHLEALPHPSDTRLKCVTLEQVRQLATAHRRTLPDEVQPEIPAPTTPGPAVSTPVLSDALPDSSVLISDLIRQLDSLQAHVATLEHQLTLLTNQLQKEQEWRTSEASTAEAKSPKSSRENSQRSSKEKSQGFSRENSQRSSRENSQQPCREKSQRSSKEKVSARGVASTASLDRRKHSRVLPRVEYGAEGQYVVICPKLGLLTFEPESAEWFAWLSTLSSFRFVGASGHFTANRDAQHLPRWSWRASRGIRNRYYGLHLGKTEDLTIALLEQAAAALQAHLN